MAKVFHFSSMRGYFVYGQYRGQAIKSGIVAGCVGLILDMQPSAEKIENVEIKSQKHGHSIGSRIHRTPQSKPQKPDPRFPIFAKVTGDCNYGPLQPNCPLIKTYVVMVKHFLNHILYNTFLNLKHFCLVTIQACTKLVSHS